MDLKQLRQFMALCETLNFRKAAARLHMAQPPLSVSIRHLEDEIGARLFDRTTTGLRLTTVGKAVLDHARQTLFHAEQFRQTARLAAGGHVGSLRLDFVASSTIRLLPRAIAAFRASHPGVDLHLNEGNTDGIMRALRDGQTDLGIVRYPTPGHPTLTVQPLDRNVYVAALPVDHRFSKRARLRLEELRDEPFIFPSRLHTSAAYASALLACQQAGFMPNIVQQGAHAQTIVALVEGGLGVALVPDVWQHLAPRAVAFRRLTGMQPHHLGLALAFRTSERDSPLIERFSQAAGSAMQAETPSGRRPTR